MQVTQTQIAGKVTAASYERVSSLPQARFGYSLGAQAADAAAFCAAQGWTLPDELRFRDGEDESASGSRWDLPDLNRLLDAARDRRFQVLVVPKHDRLARNMAKGLIIVEELKKLGVRVVFMNAPSDDTPEGRLLSNQLFAFGEFERELISFRTSRGRRAKASLNIYVGNCAAPFGYEYVRDPEKNRVRGMRIVDAQAAIVRRLFDDVVSLSVGDLARQLRAEGVPAITSRHNWTTSAISAIVKNRLYLGQTSYAGIQITSVAPIVTQEQFDAVQDALTRRRDRPTHARLRDPEHPQRRLDDLHELRGLITCGHCGGLLSCVNGGPGGGWRYYRCVRHFVSRASLGQRGHCPMPGPIAPRIEAHIWENVTAMLLDPARLQHALADARADYDDADRRRQDRLAAIDGLIRTSKSRIQRITDELLDTEKGSESYQALKQRMTTEEDNIRKFLAEKAPLEAIPVAGLSAAQALSLEEFARELRAGIEVASPTERQEVYRLLKLQITLSLDPHGEPFGAHHFHISWDAVIPFASGRRAGDSSHTFQKLHGESTVYKGECSYRIWLT